MATTRRSTKAELKQARAEAARAAFARAKRRSRMRRLGLWSAAGVAVAAAAVATTVVLLNHRDTSQAATAVPASAVGAVGRTSNPPWDAPRDASAGVAAAGLSMLGEEGNEVHIHAHLDIIANGNPVQIPADIGVDEARHKISPLHSHDTTGVIHIESPVKDATFTLGQFFTEWQLSLSADHIGGLATDDSHHLKAYVNGKLRTGDPTGIVLAAHDEIAIVYGTDAQQANVPSSYQWSNGL